jgi:hypothetical protein
LSVPARLIAKPGGRVELSPRDLFVALLLPLLVGALAYGLEASPLRDYFLLSAPVREQSTTNRPVA